MAPTRNLLRETLTKCMSAEAHAYFKPNELNTAKVICWHLGTNPEKSNYGKAWPSLKKLAEETGYSEVTIWRHIQRLCSGKFPLFSKCVQPGRSNTYVWNEDPTTAARDNQATETTLEHVNGEGPSRIKCTSIKTMDTPPHSDNDLPSRLKSKIEGRTQEEIKGRARFPQIQGRKTQWPRTSDEIKTDRSRTIAGFKELRDKFRSNRHPIPVRTEEDGG